MILILAPLAALAGVPMLAFADAAQDRMGAGIAQRQAILGTILEKLSETAPEQAEALQTLGDAMMADALGDVPEESGKAGTHAGSGPSAGDGGNGGDGGIGPTVFVSGSESSSGGAGNGGDGGSASSGGLIRAGNSASHTSVVNTLNVSVIRISLH